MGKKGKVGKQRKDKYYKLAKEAGYRSRAAFKLLQLNKRFEFLQRSRAVVDLCAAPGGWMQVAVQNMPVSSLCIGVDLCPIKPIGKAIALQGDITTDSTRQAIRKELSGWEADTVLHDGAPNVGRDWNYDAFQQNCLVLSALKLTTQVLRHNGTFVTKVFRSADYQALIGVFEKLFRKVHVWKPAASRLESAEIFVVCEKYVKPAKVDPALLDPKRVFLAPSLEPTAPNIAKMMQPIKKREKRAKAEGYSEGILNTYRELPASLYFDAANHLQLLSEASCIKLDQDYDSAPETSDEVRACCSDIKVCGPRELRILINWRKAILARRQKEETAGEEERGGGDDEDMDKDPEQAEDEAEDKEMAEIDAMIARASAAEKSALKKKKKKMLKEKAKSIVRRQLGMEHVGDTPLIEDDHELFSVLAVKSAKQVAKITSEKLALRDASKTVKDQDEEMEEGGGNYGDDDDDGVEGLGEGEWEEHDGVHLGDGQSDDDDDGDGDDGDEGDAAVASGGRAAAERRVASWFQRDAIAELLGNDDDDEKELAVVEKHLARSKQNSTAAKGVVSFEDEDGTNGRKKKDDEEDDKPTSDAEDSDDGSEHFYDMEDERAAKRDQTEPPAKKKKYLTPEQLAIGEQMIYSKKAAQELEDAAWNRYTNDDMGLPDWFVEDERKHHRATLPADPARVAYYKDKQKELNVRPIKKVAQAKARKAKRVARKMADAKKRAENILDNPDMEQVEKVKEVRKLYKKALTKEKKNVKYVVMSKGRRGRASRPDGPYRVVDRRMKADKRKDGGGKGKGKAAAGGGGGGGKGGRKPSNRQRPQAQKRKR